MPVKFALFRCFGKTGGQRWRLPSPGGYVKLLAVVRAIWVGPLYQTPTPDAFEALLRADPPAP